MVENEKDDQPLVVESVKKEEDNESASKRLLEGQQEGSEEVKPQEEKKGFYRRFIKPNLLLLLTLFAVIIGLSLGFALRNAQLNELTIRFIGLPGELLMNMFKCIIIPLIFVSIVAGISSMEPSQMTRINLLALVFYLVTTLLAIIIGLVLVMTIRPGENVEHNSPTNDVDIELNGSLTDAIYDIIMSLFPDNLVTATFRSSQWRKVTIFKKPPSKNMTNDELQELVSAWVKLANMNSSTPKDNQTDALTEMRKIMYTYIRREANIAEPKPKKEYQKILTDSPNTIGLLVFAVVFGIVLSFSGEQGMPLKKIILSLDHIITRIVWLIIWYSPIGIISMLAKIVLELDDPNVLFSSLWKYMLTVWSALFIHTILLLIIYLILTRKNPLILLKGVSPMVAVAFGTSSSAAALPVHFICLKRMQINDNIAQMVLPVAATINMNGTALYEAVASIFLAQLVKKELTIADCCIISLMATVAAVGAAAIPSAGIFTMTMILSAIGVSLEYIPLIMSVDWLLDRSRTVINCLSDSVCACSLDAMVKRKKETEELENGPLMTALVPDVSGEESAPSGSFNKGESDPKNSDIA